MRQRTQQIIHWALKVHESIYEVIDNLLSSHTPDMLPYLSVRPFRSVWSRYATKPWHLAGD